MKFDNYCRAVLGGAKFVVRCTIENWPQFSYEDLFGEYCRWFVNETEAKHVAEDLDARSYDRFPSHPADVSYWVEPVDPRDLGP